VCEVGHLKHKTRIVFRGGLRHASRKAAQGQRVTFDLVRELVVDLVEGVVEGAPQLHLRGHGV